MQKLLKQSSVAFIPFIKNVLLTKSYPKSPQSPNSEAKNRRYGNLKVIDGRNNTIQFWKYEILVITATPNMVKESYSDSTFKELSNSTTNIRIRVRLKMLL